MKYLVFFAFSLSVVFCSAQSDLNRQKEYIQSFCDEHRLSFKKLEELDAILSNENLKPEKRDKKWQKCYEQWDPEGVVQEFNITKVMMRPDRVNSKSQELNDYLRGYPHEYLSLKIMFFDVLPGSENKYSSFLRNTLKAQQDTSRQAVQDDIDFLLEVVAMLETSGFFAIEEYQEMIASHQQFASQSPEELYNNDISEGVMWAFDAFMKKKGWYPDQIRLYGFNVDGYQMKTEPGYKFLKHFLGSFDYQIDMPQGRSGYKAFDWTAIDLLQYKHFFEDEKVGAVVKAQIVLEKYIAFKGEQFIKSYADGQADMDVLKSLQFVNRDLATSVQIRTKLDASIAENNVERLLLMIANEAFILPFHWYDGFKDHEWWKDLSLFDLSHKERLILDGISENGFHVDVKNQLYGNEALLRELSTSQQFKHALNVKYMQISTSTTKNYFLQRFNTQLLRQKYEYTPAVMPNPVAEKKRQAYEDSIINMLTEIILESPFRGEFRIDYVGQSIKMYPWNRSEMSRKVYQELRNEFDLNLGELLHLRFYISVSDSAQNSSSSHFESETKQPRQSNLPNSRNLSEPVRLENTSGSAISAIPPPPLTPKVVIDFPDVEASFPGGMGAFKKYLEDSMVYPEPAIALGEQGKVYLSFVVEPDGAITNVKVERGVSKDLDREAKRLLRASPKWIPGEANGKKIRTRCRYPVVFVLPN